MCLDGQTLFIQLAHVPSDFCCAPVFEFDMVKILSDMLHKSIKYWLRAGRVVQHIWWGFYMVKLELETGRQVDFGVSLMKTFDHVSSSLNSWQITICTKIWIASSVSRQEAQWSYSEPHIVINYIRGHLWSLSFVILKDCDKCVFVLCFTIMC